MPVSFEPLTQAVLPDKILLAFAVADVCPESAFALTVKYQKEQGCVLNFEYFKVT